MTNIIGTKSYGWWWFSPFKWPSIGVPTHLTPDMLARLDIECLKGMMSFTWDTTGKFLRVCPGHWSGWHGTRGIWIILALTWDIISENCVPQNPRVTHIVLFGMQWDHWDVLFPVPTSSIENPPFAWLFHGYIWVNPTWLTVISYMFDHLGDNLTPVRSFLRETYGNQPGYLQCEAPKIAKLVYNSNNYMVYGTHITIVTGAYKPTNITGGPHIVWLSMDCPRVNPTSGGAGKRTPGHVRLQRHCDAGGADWRWRWCQTNAPMATVMEIMVI